MCPNAEMEEAISDSELNGLCISDVNQNVNNTDFSVSKLNMSKFWKQIFDQMHKQNKSYFSKFLVSIVS